MKKTNKLSYKDFVYILLHLNPSELREFAEDIGVTDRYYYVNHATYYSYMKEDAEKICESLQKLGKKQLVALIFNRLNRS